jgi:hypothetical protein
VGIYEDAAPIPQVEADRGSSEFLSIVRDVIEEAVDSLETTEALEV